MGRGVSKSGGGGGGGGARNARQGGGGSADGVFPSGETRTIETTYFEGRGWNRGRYKDEVLEAHTDGNGNVTFEYASGGSYSKSAKTNVRNSVEFKIQAGAVNGETFNIDWNKVKSISGQTYNLRDAAKRAGMKWDGATKRWVRR